MGNYYSINRLKLKRIEDNQNYIIDVNNSDNVYAVKSKLSDVTKLNCDGIILIHKNRILKNDKLISDYNIDENDFVLLSDGEIDYCYDNVANWNKKNYFEIFCVKCEERRIKLENYQPKQLNDDERIHVTIIDGFGCNYRIETNRNERIYDALNRGAVVGVDWDKCRHCRDDLGGVFLRVELIHDGIRLDIDETFAHYNIRYDATIRLVKHLLGGGVLWIKPIIDHYDSCVISSVSHDKSDIINKISKEIKIPQKNIKLFLDKNQSKPIKSNIDLQKYDGNLKQIDIYYTIKPDFENLVILKQLGRGAFGKVLKCISIETKKEIAVKKLKIPSEGETKEEKLSFERELQVYSKHSGHPRIVKYERNFQTEEAVFLVMEYMKGGSLGSYLRKNGPLSENEIKKYSKQVLEALQYLHEQKILHRDIKSDNILLDEYDNVKLSDFGLSKILTDLATKELLNGVMQSFVGTVNYMAPEIMNKEPSGSSADIWSFGATMVEMVTGFPPYHKIGTYKVIKIISESRKIDYNFPNNRSASLKSFIDSCLHPEPSERLTSEQLMNHSFLQTC